MGQTQTTTRLKTKVVSSSSSGRRRPRPSRVYHVGQKAYKYGRPSKRYIRQFRGRMLNVATVPGKGATTYWNVPEVRHRGRLGSWIDLSKMRSRKFAQSGKLYRSLSRQTGESLMKYEKRARPTLKQATTIGTDFGMRRAAIADWAKLYGRGKGVKGVRSRLRKHGFRGRGPGHNRALRRLYGTRGRRLPMVRSKYTYANPDSHALAYKRRISV